MSNKKVDFRYLLKYLPPYILPITVTVVFLILSRVASAFDPYYLKKIIDVLPQTQTGGVSGQILSFLIIFFTLRFANALFEFLRDYIFSKVEMGISRDVSTDVFNHLVKLPMSFHANQKTGALARKIARGAGSINFILDFMIINILPTIVEVAIVTALLLKLYNPVFGLITLGTIIAYAWFTVVTTEKRQKFRLAANLADDEASAVQIDTITNIDTVKYFKNQESQLKKYTKAIGNWFNLSVSSNQLFALISAGQGLILLIGVGLILVLAILRVLAGQLTIGDLVLLTTYIARLSAPISVLGFVYRRIKDGFADLDEMAKILLEPIELKEDADAKPILQPKGEVDFENVSFAYRGKSQAIKNLNLKILPGQKVAFVGPSGVGKSTLVKLLFRFYDPSSGNIKIDGQEIRKIKNESLRQIMSIVPQEPVLFNDTVANNIRFGKPEASLEEVCHAAKLAGVDKFIEKLPEKYDTLVGERGIKLSGGEKQRVAIARAMIRDPKIIVFDEATSSLDSESERIVQESIHRVSEGRTAISIAHRLSTISDSDVIFVLDKGTIAEKGNHTELLQKNGIYANLWRIQSRGFKEEPALA